jgi:hypothetical protein
MAEKAKFTTYNLGLRVRKLSEASRSLRKYLLIEYVIYVAYILVFYSIYCRERDEKRDGVWDPRRASCPNAKEGGNIKGAARHPVVSTPQKVR